MGMQGPKNNLILQSPDIVASLKDKGINSRGVTTIRVVVLWAMALWNYYEQFFEEEQGTVRYTMRCQLSKEKII